MLDGAFSLHGRIGRLNFFLAGLIMIPAALVAALLLAVAISGTDRGMASLVFFGIVVVMLAIVAGWYSLSLYVRRIRDIGWSPFYFLVGWFAVDCADVVLAKLVPSLALGQDQTGTMLGGLFNLVLTLALFFWPGRDGIIDERPTSGPRPTRLDMLESSRFTASEPLAVGGSTRMPTSGASKGFGRRGVR